jgi:hypothetical protein
MNKFVLSIIAAFALCLAAAAQGGYPAGSPGTQSSPSTQQGPAGSQQPGMGQPGTSPQVGQTDQSNSGGMSDHAKGEKKLKGCVQAQGGQAMLETKKGKEVALSGQDVSAHNGHEVEVKGMWAESASAGASPTSTGAGASGEKTFNVTDVKMISETCKGGKSSGSSTGSSTGAGSSSETKPQ